MSDTPQLFPLQDQPPSVQLIVSGIVVLFSGIIFSMLFFLAGEVIFGTNLNDILLIAQGKGGENTDLIFKYLQGVQTISLFVIPALVISYMMTRGNGDWLLAKKAPTAVSISLVILLAVSLIPVTSAAGILNAKMQFPGWLSGLEKWITEKEDTASYLTGILLESNNLTALLTNLFVIAILPAVGEELFFRGVFQQIFQKMFKSGNVAVWATAIIFSTIHLQFYGFLPRLILGLVFGYLFYWGGSLWLPVTAHFVNNAIPVISSYFSGAGQSDFRTIDFSDTNIPVVITASAICIIILVIFSKKHLSETKVNK